jgi:hypothetical protein
MREREREREGEEHRKIHFRRNVSVKQDKVKGTIKGVRKSLGASAHAYNPS